MPLVEITLFEGRSDDEKRQVYIEVTHALVRSLGSDPGNVRIFLREISKMDTASKGEAFADKIAKTSA